MAAFDPSALASAEPHVHAAAERCPWCDQPVPPGKAEEIKARIAAQEREQHMLLTSRFKKRVERTKAEAAAALEQLRTELTQEFAAKEAAVREDGRKTADSALQAKLAEAEQQIQALKASQDAALQEQRQALEKAAVDAVNAERVRAFEERLKLEGQLADVQRRLQNKTADELGESAESDLFEQLKAEFTEDRIARVVKGAAGPDIFHEIFYNGKFCGRIVYDAKNRNAWRNDYVVKLRQDQIAANADHAILSSHVFPAGTHQLHVMDGVIIANPARTLVLARLLRKHVVQMHTLRMSNEARAQKTEALYEFVMSERCTQFLESIAKRTKDLQDLDIKEKKAHDTTWKRREDLIRSVQKVHGDLCFEIERIIGTG
ncbi:MAG: DUF2130 domain-containing protein [Hyphomicrobiaceae bacterium]